MTVSVRWDIKMAKRFLAFILMLATLPLCVSCGEDEIPDASVTPYGFVDPKTNIEYVDCTPMGLYPVDPGDEYIKVDGVTYYEVMLEDTKEFLCYEDSGYYFLVRAKQKKEPTISEFDPIAAWIYSSNNTTLITYFYADNKYLPEDKQEHNPTEDTWLCQMIAEYLSEGEAVDVPVTDKTITDHYYIRLLSEDYPGLFYLVSFFGYNGRYFLRDDSVGKTVYCPNDVIVRMVGEQ